MSEKWQCITGAALTTIFCVSLLVSVAWHEGTAGWVRRAQCRSREAHLAAGDVMCDCGCRRWQRATPAGPRPRPTWPRRIACWVAGQVANRYTGGVL